ncbi:cellulase family glycosylhydrolase [Glycomyces sp. TRM65418]|uniref:cellulase family glycosylhydrolase n=1 Tax=Glycomyces sp. TRM65418 TaxID=2867006 RepID=UPI001CE70D66|nr:cellulase family glycosylhydrolase [Glycomyces sp. TRM65418]MCC3764491.1 cellulase family glycosylhydrolase [Glycomyces sp. TRM65418]QZD54162.1 cellulase family glycosylhydrolase [Glycomyces sp. TRM65418]
MRLSSSNRKRLASTAVTTTAMIAAAIGLATANQASAQEGCEVDYRVLSSWSSGFQASVSITSGDAIDGWDIGWTFPEGTTVTSAWNVDWNQTGGVFSGTDVGWNGSIAAGQTRQVFGFIGSGSTAAPTGLTVNGVACGEQGEPSETPTDPTTDPTSEPPGGTPSALHAEGNELVNESGETVILNGFNRTGTEWPCIHGWGFIDGPSDDAAIDLMASWEPNAIRVPMNQQCWLGYGETVPEWTGENYRAFIEDWVTRLTEAGIYVILDLHWSSPGTEPAEGQQQMADADHSPDFWTSVAERFKDNPAVLYDLYNEPHDISDECWRDGCTVDAGWEAAGMQDLVDAVRSTGATQPVVVTCNWWGNGCGGYLDYMPSDPEDNLVASVHVYEQTGCNTQVCWDADIAPIAAEVPTMFAEFGDAGCNHDWSDLLIDWADARGIGWTAWSWYPSCDMPGLISDWDGTPTGYGEGIKEALANRP